MAGRFSRTAALCSALIAAPIALSGCQSASERPDPRPDDVGSYERNAVRAERIDERKQLPPGQAELDLTELPPDYFRLEHDAFAAHRARRFYLQGVRLLQDPSRVDEAIREFQLALETDPLFYRAHFKLGICYYRKGQYDLEIAEYKKCLATNPQYTEALLNLGHALLARDKLEDAREAYEQVIGLDPSNGVALYNLGLVEFDLRHFDRSFEYLDQFLKVHDDSGQMGQRARMYLDEIRNRRQTSEGS